MLGCKDQVVKLKVEVSASAFKRGTILINVDNISWKQIPTTDLDCYQALNAV
jgi:hypothetical protein